MLTKSCREKYPGHSGKRLTLLMPLHSARITRRSLVRIAGGVTLASSRFPLLFGASDFWNKKPVSAWSSQEIGQLTSHSPWSKEVNAEFELDSDYTTNGNAGPGIGRGGILTAPGAESQSQFEIGRDKNDKPRASRSREPVTVRWESAPPILDALGIPLPADFQGRYVLSVSGLPLGVMDKRRRGVTGPELSVDPDDNTPAGRQRRMIEQMQASATLEAKGREPAQPGLVRAVPRTAGTYLFGFSKDLLPLTVNDREVLFTLRTALMSVRAKFDPKEMVYRGQLAL